MKIGVLGATGPAGHAVSVQFAGVGHEVLVGSRALDRAEETVRALQERWQDRNLRLIPADNDTAASADLVIVATPWEGILSTVTALEAKLAGKIVISMANALTRWGKEMVPLLPPTGSVTVAVARALPGARVVGAFHHLPAGPWGDLDHGLEADVMVCSDDRDAAEEVIALIDALPGLRGVNSGGLSSALAIEALTPALLEVNRHYKVHAAIRITGLPDRDNTDSRRAAPESSASGSAASGSAASGTAASGSAASGSAASGSTAGGNAGREQASASGG